MDASNCPTVPTADANHCLKSSFCNTLAHDQIARKTCHLANTNGSKELPASKGRTDSHRLLFQPCVRETALESQERLSEPGR